MATKFNEKNNHNAIEEKFFQICAQVLPTAGYGVYDIRYLSGSSTLRLFITKANTVKGVDINDCIKVDKLISPFIENEDWIPGNFILEVSSPGLYRDIRFSDQLKYSLGDLIKIKFNSLIDDKALKNKNIVVTLLEFDDNSMSVELEEEKQKMIIKYDLIKSVNAELKI